MTLAEVKRKRVEVIEKSYLRELLARKKGKISDAAAVAGITPRQLNKLMAKYGIRRESFKDPSGASAPGRASSARPAAGSS
jgi:DNA-binding NtrC family response regulator